MIQIDYFNDDSIKYALAGVDVIISTVPIMGVDIQVKIAAVAKQVGV